ncbi:MAG: A/G-specific adenine glycosylase [Bacteroidales bacterium]|nr:A/G-specific adenine glycosylase [Bacteroidales bacterium]
MDHTDDIQAGLMAWYETNRRDLPWRRTTDPYSIWISEVILQQTRIDQGRDYYLRFTGRFPDVGSLARAGEEEVLRLWQGLGYYRRASNLLKAARIIHETFNDRFPDTWESLVTLPGIGDYTAAAILSIAFGKPYPVVDGNVVRVVARLTGLEIPADTTDGRKQIRSAAHRLMDRQQPGTFNQAIMEFGALHCKPIRPDCQHCIVQRHCSAFESGKVTELPVRNPKQEPRIRYFHYFVILLPGTTGQIVLRKRLTRDIWENLYDFPMIESRSLLTEKQLRKHPEFPESFRETVVELSEMKGIHCHMLSHQHLYVKYFLVRIPAPSKIKIPLNWIPVSPERMRDYPMPRLITRFFEKNRAMMGNKT